MEGAPWGNLVRPMGDRDHAVDERRADQDHDRRCQTRVTGAQPAARMKRAREAVLVLLCDFAGVLHSLELFKFDVERLATFAFDSPDIDVFLDCASSGAPTEPSSSPFFADQVNRPTVQFDWLGHRTGSCCTGGKISRESDAELLKPDVENSGSNCVLCKKLDSCGFRFCGGAA